MTPHASVTHRSQVVAYPFFAAAALLFVLQVIFGLIIAAQYVWPSFLLDVLPFNWGRATHLNLLTFWLLIGMMGASYYLVADETDSEIFSVRLAWANLGVLLIAGVGALLTYARSRTALNAAYASKDVPAFERNPRRIPMLIDRYYHREITSTWLARLKAKLERCLTNLSSAPVWEEVAESEPARLELPVATEPTRWRGIDLYAAPDLMFRRGEETVIVDWKTGADQQVRDQLAVCGMVFRHRAPESTQLVGCAVLLDEPAEHRHDLTDTVLIDAEARIRASVLAMRRLLEIRSTTVDYTIS